MAAVEPAEDVFAQLDWQYKNVTQVTSCSLQVERWQRLSPMYLHFHSKYVPSLSGKVSPAAATSAFSLKAFLQRALVANKN